MRFKMHCVKLDAPDEVNCFYYDNQTGLLHDGDGAAVGEPRPDLLNYIPAFKADPVKNPHSQAQRPAHFKDTNGVVLQLFMQLLPTKVRSTSQ